jgi:hypothetical protein
MSTSKPESDKPDPDAPAASSAGATTEPSLPVVSPPKPASVREWASGKGLGFDEVTELEGLVEAQAGKPVTRRRVLGWFLAGAGTTAVAGTGIAVVLGGGAAYTGKQALDAAETTVPAVIDREMQERVRRVEGYMADAVKASVSLMAEIGVFLQLLQDKVTDVSELKDIILKMLEGLRDDFVGFVTTGFEDIFPDDMFRSFKEIVENDPDLNASWNRIEGYIDSLRAIVDEFGAMKHEITSFTSEDEAAMWAEYEETFLEEMSRPFQQ